MNILYINHYFEKGGAETVFLESYNFFQKSEHKIFFCHTDKKYKADLYLSNYEESKLFGGINYLFNLKNYLKLKKFLKANKIHVVHIHSYSALSPSIFLALKSKKIVQTVHDYTINCPNNSLYNFKKNQVCDRCVGKTNKWRCIFENCEKRSIAHLVLKFMANYISRNIIKVDKYIFKYIVPSYFLKELLEKEEIDKDKIIVINNPIKAFKNKDIKKKNEIIFFGRLSKEKNVEKIIEAFKKFLEYNKEYILKIIGEGSELEQLRKLIEKLQISEYVHFKGRLDGEKLQKEIGESKISIMASKCYETYGLTPLESIVNKTIPIVRDSGATSEIVGKILEGVIFQNDTEILEKLIDVTKNYEKYFNRMNMSKEKIEKINTEYYMKLEKLYKSFEMGERYQSENN